MLAAHSTGLGLVQAVELLPLTREQPDSAFVELAKLDQHWETFLSQRHLRAYQRVRDLLSNPLFLNLAVIGHLSPGQLLDWSTTEQELRDLVLDRYLDRTLADQREYEQEDARRFLTWIARFLNEDEVSPFGLKTSDYAVFDLTDLTPPDPPKRYGLVLGLGLGLVLCLIWELLMFVVQSGVLFSGPYVPTTLGDAVELLGVRLSIGLRNGLSVGVFLALFLWPVGGPFKRSAVSSRLTLVWPSTRRQLLNFLRRAGRGLIFGLIFGLGLGLIFGLVGGLLGQLRHVGQFGLHLDFELVNQLVQGLPLGLGIGLVLALGFGLLETRSVLITSRTPREASSRS